MWYGIRICALSETRIFGIGTPFSDDGIDLVEHVRDVERNTVSEDAGRVTVEYPRRQHVKREFAVVVLYRVPRVASALEPDDDISIPAKACP